jgi:hypothetical protein
MITLNCLCVEKSHIDAIIIKKKFYKNGIDINCDLVDTEEDFITKLTNGQYDMVISNYPNNVVNFLTLLGLYEVHGNDVPLVLLFFQMSAEIYEYSKNESGKIIFLNKDKIDEVIPKVVDSLKKMLRHCPTK